MYDTCKIVINLSLYNYNEKPLFLFQYTGHKKASNKTISELKKNINVCAIKENTDIYPLQRTQWKEFNISIFILDVTSRRGGKDESNVNKFLDHKS